MRKKGTPGVLVRSTMSLYKAANTRVRSDSECSEELEVKVGKRLSIGLRLQVNGDKRGSRRHEEESMMVSLSMEGALCRSNWIVGVNHIPTRLR